MVNNYPDSADKVGFFPIPGDDAATNGLTAWMGNAVYIPKSTTGDKLEAAQKFVDFLASPAGLRCPDVRPVPDGSLHGGLLHASRRAAQGDHRPAAVLRGRGATSASRWSSSARSRVRHSSRSRSRSAQGSARRKTVRRGMTKTSRSRLSSSVSTVGELRPAPGTFVISLLAGRRPPFPMTEGDPCQRPAYALRRSCETPGPKHAPARDVAGTPRPPTPRGSTCRQGSCTSCSSSSRPWPPSTSA